MAEHRAEQVMEAVLAIVTGLVSTGVRVYRGRVAPVRDEDLPALLVNMGADRPVEPADRTMQHFDSILRVTVTPVVKTSSAQVDTLLNQIRLEAEIALAADPRLGLAWVIDSGFVGADEPDLGENDRQVASQGLQWEVLYRRSYEDPSQ